ncbi:MAG: sigma-70 family RNA polymerase sigma factor [Planctomycetes bacterium]|nr:sigma-70 family RNA polymerase sigma factor [Planctomycetota bacterium]
MIDPALVDRLSQIVTQKNPPHQEVERYFHAVRRYLRGMFHEEDIVDEMLQEFSIRFARGDFHRQSTRSGQFRFYLKTCLRNMVHDYWRTRRKNDARRAGMTPEEMANVRSREAEVSFDANWRDELLARAWKALDQDQNQTGHPHHDVLLVRAAQPEARSRDLVEPLAEKLGKPLTVANVRQLVHRARVRFAELLLEEVVTAMNKPNPDEIEAELIDLNLLEYCRHAWEQRQE